MSGQLSILVPNRNTLPYLQLCIRSLRENLAGKGHAILVLDDASTDGSVEWLEEHGKKYGCELELHRGPERLGIVGAYNRLVEAAETDAVWMVHTDMYFARNADAETSKYLAPGTVCTCTRIEPPIYPPAPCRLQAPLGAEAGEFMEGEFLRLAEAKAEPGRFTEGIFAPVMCRREDYRAVGGLDPVFAPQSREDSDLFNRMARAGYRFRQSWSAFCYHFSGRGSRRKDGAGGRSEEWQRSNYKNERNFIRRWGASVRQGEYLEPVVPAREPLSLVALMGREPQNVVPFLRHLEPYFDEVVFVADGEQPECEAQIRAYIEEERSLGPTLLREDKIRVVKRRLGGDFGSQRNFGQRKCTNKWVLHADLDERFDPAILESLQDLVAQMKREGKELCGFARLNFLDGVLVNDVPRGQWTPQGLSRLKGRPPGGVRNLDRQFRLMRRVVRWVGAVHEGPETLGKNIDAAMFWARGAIRHEKALQRQLRQDAAYEKIRPGGSLRPEAPTEVPARRRSRVRRYRLPKEKAEAAHVSEYKLLMLATEYPPARGYGLARYAQGLAKALAAVGSEVHVVNLNYSGGRPGYEEDGVAVHEATDVDNPEHYDWVSSSVTVNLWLMERAQEVMREHRPFDFILAHDWLGALAAKGLKTVHGLPLVLFMHDTEPGKRGNKLTPEQLYIAQLETWACGHADAVIANSDALADEVQHFHKVPDEKLSVVPCGVDPARFQTDCHVPDFKALFAGSGEKLVLCLGRLSPAKGVDVLVEAVPAILRKRARTRFLIAGDGVLRGKLRARAGELGVADHVCFLGHLSGKVLGAAYRAADLVVVPSRYEPFGLVALEAMSCGTPVAAADVGGLKDIVPEEGATRRFAPGEAEALAESVAGLLGRKVTAKTAAKLRAHASKYNWDETARAVLALCTELAGRRRGATA